jgi:AraC-like DNA-binding protein
LDQGVHQSADARDFLRSGVSDPSHFTQFFRKQTGMTPQAFREGRGG